MRITNTMMRNNSLLNMQKNKAAYNKYLEQYNTEKKISRPSDDPTIAVRALKYRSTLVEIKQYKSNIDDARAWMDATETYLKDVNGRMDEMISYCTQAATGTYSAEQRQDIVTQLKQFSQYIYEQDANADYAGRYLFTGYRTDVPMLFDKAQKNVTYAITENLDINEIKKYQYVYGQAEYSATATADDYASSASKYQSTHRIALSYDNVDANGAVTLRYKDSTGASHTLSTATGDITIKSVVTKNATPPGTDKYNEHLNPGENDVYYVPETGELVFGDKIYEQIRAGSDLKVDYNKTEFDKNDIRPEHYFICTATDNTRPANDPKRTINYTSAGTQSISYQVNFSQTLAVNTEGCNAISMSVGRKIDEIINICNDYDVIEANLRSVEKRIADCDEGDTATLENLNELKSQLETQIALQKQVLGDALGSGITTCQESQDCLNIALADHGARYKRMEMTEEGLKTQEMDTEEAKSENEDADLGEAYVLFNQANLLYQATLGATSKILGQSLLNFI